METNEQKFTNEQWAALVAELRAHIARQDLRIAELEKQLGAAKKTSRNSSKPPSSDIVKPPVDPNIPGRKRKRLIGGQQEHPKHDSELTLDHADQIVEFKAQSFSKRRSLVPAPDAEPKILFQYELVERPVELTAYVAYPFMDRTTGQIVYPPFPREVEMVGRLSRHDLQQTQEGVCRSLLFV